MRQSLNSSRCFTIGKDGVPICPIGLAECLGPVGSDLVVVEPLAHRSVLFNLI